MTTRVRPVAAPLALAALLVLAGCGGSFGGGAGSPTETLTPVDVPADRAAGAPVVAPGLSEERVYAPRTLQRAYRGVLAERSFRLYRSATVYPRGELPADVAPGPPVPTGSPPATAPPETGPPREVDGATATPTAAMGTPRSPTGTPTTTGDRPVLGVNDSYNRIVVRSLVDDREAHYAFSRIETAAPAYRTSAPFARIDVWYSAPVVRNRLVDAEGVVRYWGRNEVQPGGPISDPTRAEFVVRDLAAFELRVADERVVDGRTRYRLVGSLDDDIETPTLVTDPRDGRIEAVVAETGLVRRYRLSYDAEFEGRPVTVVKTHAVVDVGSTRVARPGWLAAANESVADRFVQVTGASRGARVPATGDGR